MKDGGKIKGYNTDYFGFKYSLERNRIEIEGKKCIVLGSGGASLTVQAVLKDMNAKSVTVISRHSEENNYKNIEKHYDAEIIVNATPVGMYPNNGKSLVNLDHFKNCTGVADLVYNPNKSKLILDAMERKIPCCGGLSMLVAQAKKASEIFQKKPIDDDEISAIIYEIRSKTLNIILIGMPGAGKTYLGKKIAEKEHRKFVDIDDMIVEHENRSIPEIFARDGEDYFRNVETEMLREACKQTGIVIACGGGVVKRKQNYAIAKQNGRIIWVKRDIDKLDLSNRERPLCKVQSTQQIFEERKDAYEFWSDYFIDNNQDFN